MFQICHLWTSMKFFPEPEYKPFFLYLKWLSLTRSLLLITKKFWVLAQAFCSLNNFQSEHKLFAQLKKIRGWAQALWLSKKLWAWAQATPPKNLTTHSMNPQTQANSSQLFVTLWICLEKPPLLINTIYYLTLWWHIICTAPLHCSVLHYTVLSWTSTLIWLLLINWL